MDVYDWGRFPELSAGEASRSFSPKSFPNSPLMRSEGMFWNSETVMHLFSTFAKTTAEADERLSSACKLEALRLASGVSKLSFLSAMTYQTFPVYAASASALIRCLASFRALRRSSTDSPRVNERFGGVSPLSP